jgi:glycosyltransferase involved in cell wall biosynthesis
VKICVLNWLDRENPQAGGAELHLHETFGRIAAAGHEVTLITSGWGADEPNRLTLDGMSVIRCGKRLTYPLFVRSAYQEARQQAGPFDTVVEDLNKIPLFTPHWVGAPVVLLVHHLFGTTAFREAPLPIAAATWLLERPIGRMYRGVPTISVSESTATDLVGRGLEEDDITVIHNGVDLARFGPGEDRSEVPTLLFLGRLKRYKRISLIIDALAKLTERGIDARLHIAGTGDHRATLEAEVRTLGLDSRVEFLGYVSEAEKATAYQQSWVHVLMSEKEGWGLTNIEAAACGTATVAADAPGLRDSVRDGVTGVLVSGEDSSELADALAPFLSDRAYADKMGDQAATFAGSLSWDRAADAVIDFLARELARAPS